MQILKINSTNFNGKITKPSKNITQNVINQNIPQKMLGLVSLASTGNASISINKDKSYERTLDENFFKLPEGAEPDIFQKASATYLYNGNDVLVTAPTGTGKTAIAHYIVTKNLEEGKKTFYTTPLKALSNEKFRSFQKTYGEKNVGLITGDTKINKDAPIVIMTTEVYRNMIFGEQFKEHNPILENLKTVIFDELHYLGDIDRGGVWEQSIIFSEPETQILSLSATIGNNSDVARWMAESRNLKYFSPQISNDKIHNADFNTIQKAPKQSLGLINVPSENRHVPLNFSNILINGNKKANPKTTKISDNLFSAIPTPSGEHYKQMVTTLKKNNQLPAIFFIFSKRGCKNALDYLAHFGQKLNSENEIEKIKEILKRYKKEGKYLGETLNTKALESGYAIHNSGMLPTQKELIEELFQKKLIKVVLATETLSAGINMPAKTTVISSYMKPTSEKNALNGRRKLTPNEFHQMAGRAGRRGIDTKGFCYTMSMNPEQKAEFDSLILSGPNKLESAFNNPDYSFVASYYDICETDDLIKEIGNRSFFVYDKNKDISEAKKKDFMKNFGLKRKILRKFDYMNSNHELKTKGFLITKLNGYEQIPIINAIDSKIFANLTPIELAGAIGGMANIELVYDAKKDNDSKNTDDTFSHENDNIEFFVLNQTNKINQYNNEVSKIDSSHREIKINHSAVSHLYNWAKLNSENNHSTENWSNIIKTPGIYPIKDEGSLFKEISMTIDLLKQITEICDEGIRIACNNYEKKYYSELKATAQESIILLSKSPVV